MEKSLKANLKIRYTNLSDYQALVLLYVEYLTALSKYTKFEENLVDIAKEEVATAEADFYTNIFIISYMEVPIGFAIIGGHPTNSFCKDDIYIQEFFIKSSFARQGIGKESVKFIVNLMSGGVLGSMDISLFILKENEPALAFWDSTMKELGFIDIVSAKGFEALPEGNTDFVESNSEAFFRYYEYFKTVT